MGGLFRIAEAFGVQAIIFCGTQPQNFGRRMQKTARNTEKSVTFSCLDSAEETMALLAKDSYPLVALEITESSQDLGQFDFSQFSKLALIVGNENHGISSDFLKAASYHLHINMYGHNSSMNVVQATSIGLYEITKQWQ